MIFFQQRKKTNKMYLLKKFRKPDVHFILAIYKDVYENKSEPIVLMEMLKIYLNAIQCENKSVCCFQSQKWQ